MDLVDFIGCFAEQFDETDADEIKADTNFQELNEWGSLTSMSVIAFVKTKYGKTVTGKEIRMCETVTELFDLISSK